jgi:hypothetical protein
MSWQDIKARWSQGWRSLQQQAMHRYEAAIRRDPRSFEPTVRATIADLQVSRGHLEHIGSMLPAQPATDQDLKDRATYGRLLNRYQNLAAGIYADARPVTDQMGIAPIIIVAGLVLGIAAIAWGAAANKYASNLREQTALADRELTARIEASQQGRTLPPSTLPPTDDGKGGGLGWLLVGGLAVAAGAVVVPVIWKKRGS